MAPDHAVLSVHRNPRKIAHVLIGAGKLIKQRGFAAVLIACQRKPDGLTGADLLLGLSTPIIHRFTNTGMGHGKMSGFSLRLGMGRMYVRQLHHGRIRLPQGQLIATKPQLQRITQRRRLDHGHLGTRRQSHIQNVLSQRRLLTFHRRNIGVLTRL